MKKSSIYIFLVCLYGILLFTQCSRLTFDENWLLIEQFDQSLSVYAPLDDSIFPADFTTPKIFWQSCDAAQYAVAVTDSLNQIYFSTLLTDTSCVIDELAWQQILTMQNKPLLLTVLAVDKKVIAGTKIHFSISNDAVQAPIFYRSVPLPFEYALRHLDEIEWKLGYISDPKKPKVMLKNLPLCGNCHSFSDDGKVLAMDVDYANDKGSFVTTEIEKNTVMTPEKIISWSEFRNSGNKTFGLLSQISPDGRYVVSTVQDRSIFVPKPDLYYSQLFFPIKGILAVYDRETNTFFNLPGADDPAFVQSNPEWSPDGNFIYFSRSTAYHSRAAEASESIVLPTEAAQEFLSGEQEFKYDIYRIPFNRGRGGVAEPVKGASMNGMSNFFAKVSPDGKWLAFVQADNFMLLQPDSKLVLLPLAGGNVRQMECNTENMNSWHSWSPNSKWLVFSSKKFSAFTELFLTRIDDDGHASAPVWLHQFSKKDRAVNIPEFINLHRREWASLQDQFTNQAHYYFSIGRNKLGEKMIEDAMQAFDQAIAMDSTFRDAFVYKGHVHFANERYNDALQAYKKAIDLDAKDANIWQNYAAALARLNKDQQAQSAFLRAVQLDGRNYEALVGLGVLHKKNDDYDEAISYLTRAISLQKYAGALQERGLCYAFQNKFAAAEKDFAEAILVEKNDAGLFQHLATARYQQKKYADALTAFLRAAQLDDNNAALHAGCGDCYMHLQQYENAFAAFDRCISLEPDGAVYLKRGYVSAQLGHTQSACNDFTQARSLGLRQAEAYLEKYCR